MTKAYITYNEEWPEPYWVAVSCPGCGMVHGFFEKTEEFAKDTAELLKDFPHCLKCLRNPDRINKPHPRLCWGLTDSDERS